MLTHTDHEVANRKAHHANSRLIGLLLLVLGVFAVGAAFGSALARGTVVGPHSTLVAPDGNVPGGAAKFEQQAHRRRAAPNQTALDAKALALKNLLELQVRSGPAGPAWRRLGPHTLRNGRACCFHQPGARPTRVLGRGIVGQAQTTAKQDSIAAKQESIAANAKVIAMQDSITKQALASAGANQDIVTVRMDEWKRSNRLRGTTLASATVVKDAYIIKLRPNVTQVRQCSFPSSFAGGFLPAHSCGGGSSEPFLLVLLTLRCALCAGKDRRHVRDFFHTGEIRSATSTAILRPVGAKGDERCGDPATASITCAVDARLRRCYRFHRGELPCVYL
jgi:hypothetical protein